MLLGWQFKEVVNKNIHISQQSYLLRARDRTRPPWCWRCGGKYFIGLPVATIPSPFSNWVRKWRQDIKSLFSKFKSRIRRQIQSKIILMGHSWVILGHSSSFWIIPAHSRSFQVIPRFSNYHFMLKFFFISVF